MGKADSDFFHGLTMAVATGFGLGYLPVASGTFGTLPGIPLALALARWYSLWWWQGVVAVILTLLAVPVCSVAERRFGRKDDGRIVADEWMLFPLCTVGLPLLEHWLVLLPICFISARFFDILKPPPARRLQRLPGGSGVVIDDFIASLYALVANHLLWWFVVKPYITGG